VVGYYRLKEVGYALRAGAQVLSPEEFSPIADATALLTDAEARAASIVAAAEEAYRRECQRGYDDGLARSSLEAAERLLKESAALDAKLLQFERDLVQIVTVCVRKLIDTFDDVSRAEAVVRGALRQMRREKKAELRVSPGQVAHFRSCISAILQEFPEVELVDIVEDALLVAPQVVLETSVGRVEANFGERLAELETIIRSAAAQRLPAEARDESASPA
jgi:type III secretion protein L